MTELRINSYASRKCPVVTRWDYDPSRKGLETKPSDGELRRQTQGIEFERGIIDEIISLGGFPLTDLRELSWSESIVETKSALLKNEGVILGSALECSESGRTGAPDILVYLQEGWLPIDIKNHQFSKSGKDEIEISTLEQFTTGFSSVEIGTIDPAHMLKDGLQLAHYQCLLEELGFGNDSGRAGIIDNSRRLTWVDLKLPSNSKKSISLLDEYKREFSFRVEIARTEIDRAENSATLPIVFPIKKAECSTCKWEDVCREILEAEDHVSLLSGINKNQAALLVDLGFARRSDLAKIDVNNPPIITDVGIQEKDWINWHDTALAYFHEEKFMRRGISTIEVPRASVEVDVDMESIDGRVYLWGIYVTNHSALKMEEGFIDRFSYFEGPIDGDIELKVFEKFWLWLLGLKQQCDDSSVSLRFYVYSGPTAEYKHIYSLGQNLDSSLTRKFLEQFIKSEYWVDLLPIVKDCLVSSDDYSLKTVAKWSGFSWRSTNPGGDQSQVWYESAISNNGSDSQAMLQELLEYNEDDVLATKSLREWLGSSSFRSISEINFSH